MGVHGLTSYISKQSTLASSLHLPAPLPSSGSASDAGSRRPFIVDGMAFLYHVGLSDTLQGGNYGMLRERVRRYVQYWTACGLIVEVVWDGPFDSSKLPTTILRSSQSLAKSLTYMRTSPHKLATQPHLTAAAQRLPILSQAACVAELRSLGVPQWWSEAEADGPTAELAGRRGKGSLMASNDSDYFIFPTAASYAPLHLITYGSSRTPRLPPLDSAEQPEMQLIIYHHIHIAASLSLPPARLPLFAALVGNDQCSFPELLMPSLASPAYKGRVGQKDLLRIARTLASVPLDLPPADALAAAVQLLAPSAPFNPDRLPALLGSANSYLLLAPPGTRSSSSFPFAPRASDSLLQATCRSLYLQAWNGGALNTFALSVLKHGLITPGGAVEQPERQSPSISVGRGLRMWIYAVLRDGLGGLEQVTEVVRRQEELVEAVVQVPKVSALLGRELQGPLLLKRREERMAAFFAALRWSSLPRAILPGGELAVYLPLVLGLRWIGHTLPRRPWSRSEVSSALLVAVLLQQNLPLSFEPELVPDKEHIQRSVELTQALHYIRILSEVMLLTDEVRAGWDCFEGAWFHALLLLGEAEGRGGWESVELRLGLGDRERCIMRQLEGLVSSFER